MIRHHKGKHSHLRAMLLLPGALAGAALLATAQAPISMEAPVTLGSQSVEAAELPELTDSIQLALDSIRREKATRLSDRAGELYKDVKTRMYEGELESALYPAVYEANAAAVTALDSAYDDAQRQRAMLILSDLNPSLLQGAIYWSGQGNSAKQSQFARAYIDAQNMPGAEEASFERNNPAMPSIAYCAAYGATSEGDTEAAKRYLKIYLDSGDNAYRQNVYKYYGQACLATGDYINGVDELEKGILRYPTDMDMLRLAIQTCIEGDLTERMQPLLDKALAIDPNDEKLVNLQAQLLERNQDYREALNLWQQLAERHPNSLEIHRSIANCYYNLGASHYNSSILSEDDKSADRHRRQSKTYFTSAVTAIGHILANTPSDIKYLRALAHTYAALGERAKFEETNGKIIAFGEKGVNFNDMPTLIGTDRQSVSGANSMVKIPTYEEFARPFIEQNIKEWAKKGEFEKLEDYNRRINSGVDQAYEELNARAEKEYLRNFSRQLVISDLRLSTYDIENESYRIDTPYGPTVVKVPVKNHEAEAFKAGWETARIRSPKFIIRDNKPAISDITYVVNGRKYTYRSDDAATYSTPHVAVKINLGGEDNSGNQMAGTGTIIFKDSDVDKDIPVTGRKSPNLFALVIANQNYSKAAEVSGALHDGHAMKEYITKTFGAPENQVILLNDGTGNQIRDALATLSRKVKGAGAQSEVIVYYAGHGLPDPETMEAYMMPVDANPLLMSTLIPMKEFYSTLASIPAASTSVFIDACFSGEGRDGKSLRQGERSVVLKTKPAAPEGDMFVLTATSAQETALPYREKDHGLFTYFLLKKFKDSKGNATLKQIAEDVIPTVRRESDAINGKVQNPTVSTSGKMRTTWENKKLKP